MLINIGKAVNQRLFFEKLGHVVLFWTVLEIRKLRVIGHLDFAHKYRGAAIEFSFQKKLKQRLFSFGKNTQKWRPFDEYRFLIEIQNSDLDIEHIYLEVKKSYTPMDEDGNAFFGNLDIKDESWESWCIKHPEHQRCINLLIKEVLQQMG